jgi:hypothetical protein
MGWQTLSLPKRSETFKRSIHKSICRIGVRQPIIFRRVQNPSLVSVVPTELIDWSWTFFFLTHNFELVKF